MTKKTSKEKSIKFFQFLAKQGMLRVVMPALFTEGELDDIAKRIMVVGLFDAGYSQRDIASEIGVSLSFVTRTLGRMRHMHDSVQAYAKSLSK